MRSQIRPAYERTQCRCRPSSGDSPYYLRFLRRVGGRGPRRPRYGRPESALGSEMSKTPSKLDRDHVRLPTLASRRVKFQEALVDHHAEPITKVDRRIFTTISVRSQTRQYRRRTSSCFVQEAAQKASLWDEHLVDEEETAFGSEATADGFAQRGGRRGLFSRVAYRGSAYRRQHGGCGPDFDISWRSADASSFLP